MNSLEKFLQNPEIKHIVEDETLIKLSVVIIGSGLILMILNQLVVKKLG